VIRTASVVVVVLSVAGVRVAAQTTTPVIQWVLQFGTGGADRGKGIAVDGSGNLYVTGYTDGELDGQPSAGGYDIFVVKYSSDGEKHWTRLLGSTSTDLGYDIAVDGWGNVYVTGYTYGGSLDGNPSAGGYDIFVVKYSSVGEKQWTRQFGTRGDDYGNAIAVDGWGNVYVTGGSGGVLDGQPSPGGNGDIFVVKYSSDGEKHWTRLLGGIYQDWGTGVAVDGWGNVYVTGCVGHNLTTSPPDRIFVAKLSSTGEQQWWRELTGGAINQGQSIAVDGWGNVYVTGRIAGSLDGNPSIGGFDVFVVKYTGDGTKRWTKQFGSIDSDYGRDIAVDEWGNVYVTGCTDGSFDGNPSAGGDDIFVVKYNSDGERQWTKLWGSTGPDSGESIAVDGFGNVYVTGQMQYEGTPWSGGDVFIMKLTQQVASTSHQPPAVVSPGEVRVVGGPGGYINTADSPNVRIHFRRTAAGVVTVRIYDLRGRLVAHAGKDGSAGTEDDLAWNAGGMPAGVYVVAVSGGGIDKRLRVAVVR